MQESKGNERKELLRVTWDYDKHHRLVPCSGAIGGLTATGDLRADLYVELGVTPEQQLTKIYQDKDGKQNEESSYPDGLHSIRRIQVSLFVPGMHIKAFSDWVQATNLMPTSPSKRRSESDVLNLLLNSREPSGTQDVYLWQDSDPPELSISNQLERLKALRDGWLDGHGTAPSIDGLDWLAGELERRFRPGISVPYLYPMEAGGVQAEWTKGRHDISMEINLTERTGELYSLHLDDDWEVVGKLDLSCESSWEIVTVLIEGLDRLTDEIRYAITPTNTSGLFNEWKANLPSFQSRHEWEPVGV